MAEIRAARPGRRTTCPGWRLRPGVMTAPRLAATTISPSVSVVPSHCPLWPPLFEVQSTGTAVASTSEGPRWSNPLADVSTTLTNWPGETSWMDEASAMRRGTAAEPGGVPARSPGPNTWVSVRSWPLRSGAASCLPEAAAPSMRKPSDTIPGGTWTRSRSAADRAVPAGRSRAAASAVTVESGAGVSCWTAIAAAAHKSNAAARRRLRLSQAANRECRGRFPGRRPLLRVLPALRAFPGNRRPSRRRRGSMGMSPR